MAGKKPIQRFLGAIDDALGTGVFKKTTRVPKGVTITTRPKETGPVQRMYHGSGHPDPNSRPGRFDPAYGTHLTQSPDVATFYAINKTWDNERKGLLGEAGPRIDPMLVDPGKSLRIPGGEPNWEDPEYFAGLSTMSDLYPDYDMDAIKRLAGIMDESGNLMPQLEKLGYDSIDYGHVNPFGDEESRSLLLRDLTKAVPEFSEEGRRWANTRGVLAAEPPSEWSPEEWEAMIRRFNEK